LKLVRAKCMLGDLIIKAGYNQTSYAALTNRKQRMISYMCSNERVMQPEDFYYAKKYLNATLEDIYVFKEVSD